MDEKKTLMQKWCDQAWLQCLYLIGIIMANILMLKWNVWDVPQKLMCMLTIMIPVHVFEENTFPGGFFYMNNLGQKSDAPLVYPQNRFTNMCTNLGAEIIFIILLLFTKDIPAIAVTVVVLFGIGEVVHHTRAGFNMYNRYKDKGKRTLYGPGTITSYIGLLEMSVYGIYWLGRNSFTLLDMILGLVIVVCVIVFGILIPFAISRKVKTPRYAFKSNGYFSKFEQY